MSDEVDDFYLEFLDELGRVVNEDLDWLSRDALLAGRFSLRRSTIPISRRWEWSLSGDNIGGGRQAAARL